MRKVVSHIDERTPRLVTAEPRWKVMHGLPDHDQVVADCRDVYRVQFGTTGIHEKLADFGYRAENVVESIAEIPWAQSATASATAEAATRSSM